MDFVELWIERHMLELHLSRPTNEQGWADAHNADHCLRGVEHDSELVYEHTLNQLRDRYYRQSLMTLDVYIAARIEAWSKLTKDK